MSERNISPVLPFLFLLIFLAGCAGQVPPGGGPVDTTPPTVIRTSPDSNAVHVNTRSVELEFSEYVDRRSVEESIFISPYPGEIEFDWGTTDVTINFQQDLRKNTTYVVNVGTDVKDRRAGNKMAAGYTLAFSTGDSIDRGVISGRVFDEKPQGIMMFAYALERYKPDTLNPSKVKPDYIMQTGKDGSFVLSHLAFGPYRIIAVRDEYHNLVYDKQVDQYGVTVGDTSITPDRPTVTNLWFRLSTEDTAKPFLTGIQTLNDHHLRARFSEPVDSISFGHALFEIHDTLKGTSIGIVLADRNSSMPSAVDILTSTALDSAVGYRLTARNIFDRAGNPLDSANASLPFTGTATPDTLLPIPEVEGITDSTRGVPLDRKFVVRFSEPVHHEPLNGMVRLVDTVKTPVDAVTDWLSATDLLLTPTAPLKSKLWYAIRVVLDSVRDYSGNRWKDSVWSVHFQSLDLRTTGTVEGVVADTLQGKQRGPIYVTAHSVDMKPPVAKTLRLGNSGAFVFEQLPEGRYTFSAFRDDDSSGTYSFGKPYPFVPSERFTFSADTIRVRARWGVEGVLLKFR